MGYATKLSRDVSVQSFKVFSHRLSIFKNTFDIEYEFLHTQKKNCFKISTTIIFKPNKKSNYEQNYIISL